MACTWLWPNCIPLWDKKIQYLRKRMPSFYHQFPYTYIPHIFCSRAQIYSDNWHIGTTWFLNWHTISSHHVATYCTHDRIHHYQQIGHETQDYNILSSFNYARLARPKRNIGLKAQGYLYRWIQKVGKRNQGRNPQEQSNRTVGKEQWLRKSKPETHKTKQGYRWRHVARKKVQKTPRC